MQLQLLTAPASVSSGAATPVPPPARLLRLPPCFPHLRRSPPRLLALTARPPLPILPSSRPVRFTPRAHGCSGQHHQQHGHCCHGHRGVDAHGAGGGAAVMRAARAIGLAGVADALRERVQVCCASLGLLLAAAACPHVAPIGSARHLQAALVAVAYPLVGVMLTQLLLIS